jgi:ABC-2 type transport system permease protein
VNTGQFAGSSTSYFKYTVVGLLFASILEPTAIGTSTAARNEQVMGTLEYIASQPVRRVFLGIGWSAYNLLQSMVVAIAVVLLATTIGFRTHNLNFPVVLGVIILSILVFTAVGNFSASIVIVFQQGTAIITGVLSIIGTISGTLFPITELPRWLQIFSNLSPLTYAYEALRSATLSGQPATSYTRDFLVLGGFALVLLPLSAWVLEGSFRIAQKQGTLSTF